MEQVDLVDRCGSFVLSPLHSTTLNLRTPPTLSGADSPAVSARFLPTRPRQGSEGEQQRVVEGRAEGPRHEPDARDRGEQLREGGPGGSRDERRRKATSTASGCSTTGSDSNRRVRSGT